MSRKLIAEIENLGLSFRAPTFRSWTLRDEFVRLARRPASLLHTCREKLDVLHNISFQIHQGDRIGILGVNGVGKTTLCRCLAGMYNPTRGSSRIYGSVRGVFDTAIGIYPELTGRENARLMMHFLYPESPHQHAEMITEALEFSELGDFLDRPFRLYSNGMQARLCLSLISCQPADLLILDEVFDGADRFFREKISKRILSLIQRSGAVLFVSHSTEQISRVCNRAILLNEGQLVFDGDVQLAIEIYSGSRSIVDEPGALHQTPINSLNP